MSEGQRPVFELTRCRFVRTTDGACFSGWIESLRGGTVAVRNTTQGRVAVGDTFSFEVYGEGQKATFQASLAAVSLPRNIGTSTSGRTKSMTIHRTSALLAMRLVTSPVVSPSTESARVLVTEVAAIVKIGDGTVKADVADVSSRGIGLLCEQELPANTKVEIQVITEFGVVRVSGETKYCVALPDMGDLYRVGVALDELSRMDKPRWLRLMMEAA